MHKNSVFTPLWGEGSVEWLAASTHDLKVMGSNLASYNSRW